MGIHDLTSIEEVQARQEKAARDRKYAVVRLSPRRWAVVEREIHVGRRLVGYGKVTPSGLLGHRLEDPKYLEDWVTYSIVEGYGSMTEDMALRALYDLTVGG